MELTAVDVEVLVQLASRVPRAFVPLIVRIIMSGSMTRNRARVSGTGAATRESMAVPIVGTVHIYGVRDARLANSINVVVDKAVLAFAGL